MFNHLQKKGTKQFYVLVSQREAVAARRGDGWGVGTGGGPAAAPPPPRPSHNPPAVHYVILFLTQKHFFFLCLSRKEMFMSLILKNI